MKPEEINVAIGQELKAQIGTNYRCFIPGQGGEIIFCSESDAIELCENAPQHKYQSYPVYRNYYGDWNTRLDLLKALNRTQKLNLISKVWWYRGSAVDVNDSRSLQTARELLILEMPQFEFCEMWLRTLGKWVETKGEGE